MRTVLLALALCGAGALSEARAQTGFLVYGGYDTTSENPLLGVGIRFATPLPSPVLISFQPAVELQFEEDVTVVQGDFNLLGEYLGGGSVVPYAGAGLNIFHVDPDGAFGDSDTDVGVNLLVGFSFESASYVSPFVQGQFSTHDDFEDAFAVKAGIIFGM